MRVWVLINRGAAAALLLALGCSAEPARTSTPEQAVERIIAGARTGNRAAVYELLGPQTRARLEALQGDSRRLTGRLVLKAEDFLSVGWAPPAWETQGFRTLRRDAAQAEVEVFSAAGDRYSVNLVRIGDDWRIELPGR